MCYYIYFTYLHQEAYLIVVILDHSFHRASMMTSWQYPEPSNIHLQEQVGLNEEIAKFYWNSFNRPDRRAPGASNPYLSTEINYWGLLQH